MATNKVTREMIGAAHDICLKKGDFVLSADLLERIYLAMDALANPNETSGSLFQMQEVSDEIERLEKELAEAQAREAKLRAALMFIDRNLKTDEQLDGIDFANELYEIEQALALPTDDTALKEFKRKVLLDAADQFDIEANVMHIDGMVTVTASNLRRMAEEV